MGTETELKLLADNVDFDWIDGLTIVREHTVDSPSIKQLTTVYYDTPDLTLRDRQVSIRLRDTGDQWLQTVKAGGTAHAGLHERKEWEIEVEGQALELERVESDRIRALLTKPEIGDHLEPVFTTAFQRRAWDLRFDDGTHIELAADSGTISAGESTSPIAEVELELKTGATARLYELAIALNDAQPLHLSSASKAARGYELVRPSGPPAAMHADDSGLKRSMTLDDAFAAILRSGMAQLHANERILFDNPDDPEGVHQMRVATRRLRSCFRFYRPWVPKPTTEAIAGELKWLTTQLGPARDWDVFLLETIDPILGAYAEDADFGDASPTNASLRAVRVQGEAILREAYDEARATVRSARYTRLLLTLAAWIEERAWQKDANTDREALAKRAEPIVRRRLARRDRRLRKRGRHLATMSGEERHSLRIALKKHRYACRFFAEILSEERGAAYFRAMSRLQNSLGTLNDLHTLGQRLDALADRADPCALALIRGTGIRAKIDEQRTLQKRWRAFAKAR